MITILTDQATNSLGQTLYQKLAKTGQNIKLFCMDDLHVEPCYACRGCEEKTYGRCVIRDDADLILPCLVRSETIIVLTSIVFGGYSFPIKRIVDRFALLVDQHYSYRKGELVKGAKERFPRTQYYVIGIHDGADPEEVQAFRQLVMETIQIAAWAGRSFALSHDALIRKVAES
ncbi:MAG: NAD(P)H-dependent oxidoreductase [Oscillospiraceae bacterium]|nr:NAD(P)H-dependent oxidoreductase [Oscillospiraceae bacterium]